MMLSQCSQVLSVAAPKMAAEEQHEGLAARMLFGLLGPEWLHNLQNSKMADCGHGGGVSFSWSSNGAAGAAPEKPLAGQVNLSLFVVRGLEKTEISSGHEPSSGKFRKAKPSSPPWTAPLLCSIPQVAKFFLGSVSGFRSGLKQNPWPIPAWFWIRSPFPRVSVPGCGVGMWPAQ